MSRDREDATPIDVPLSEAELQSLEGTAPGGMVEIGARDLRRLLAQLRAAQAAIAAERERCAKLVRLTVPETTYYTDATGEERECVDWGRTAEKLELLIREGKE